MTNSDFHNKLKSLTEIIKHHGGEPGTCRFCVDQFTDLDGVDLKDVKAIKTTREIGRQKVWDEYLMCLIILHSDKNNVTGTGFRMRYFTEMKPGKCRLFPPTAHILQACSTDC